VLVWTSLPPAVRSATTVLAPYRRRWQVERAIKRCKSPLAAAALRARHGSPLAALWLHGKLLYALLVDKRMRRTRGAHWSHLDRARTATWWRPWKLMQQALLPRLTGALSWPEPAWDHVLTVLAERLRRRTLQRLPEVLCAPPSHVDMDLSLLEGEAWEEVIAA